MGFANGYSMLMVYNTDPLGILYGCFAALWSLVLLLGSIYLILNRTQQCVRLRNLALSLSSIAVLHIYWILCLLAYMLQGYFPCSVEFWIMSIYLPLGIALFHAANTQLLQVAMLQKQYLHAYTPLHEKTNNRFKLQKLHQSGSIFYSKDKIKRTVGYISCFMVLELMLTLFIFSISRKFHPAFGLTSPASDLRLNNGAQCSKQQGQDQIAACDALERLACRRGWEWIPSILWQFFWAWIYAPYLLWNLQGIKDIHGWRMQTVVCCLAGLPASPMWLAALYVPQMRTISRYYIPPMWFVPSIFLIEAVIVFVPCFNVVMNKRLERQTEQIIKEWQNKRHGSAVSLGEHSSSTDTASSHHGSTVSTPSIYRGQMYTMEALETTLRQNHQPLLHFASLRDFSGENISFLVHVMNWKLDWLPASPMRKGYNRLSRIKNMKGNDTRRHQFEKALNIYTSFVSLRYSNYSINLSSSQYKRLEDLFEGAASMVHGPVHVQTDAVTPFNDVWTTTASIVDTVSSRNGSSTASTITAETSSNSSENVKTALSESLTNAIVNDVNKVGQTLPDYVQVPASFGPNVFDAAEESIKYMVLTNTWCKFVKESESNANQKSLVYHLRGICA